MSVNEIATVAMGEATWANFFLLIMTMIIISAIVFLWVRLRDLEHDRDNLVYRVERLERELRYIQEPTEYFNTDMEKENE